MASVAIDSLPLKMLLVSNDQKLLILTRGSLQIFQTNLSIPKVIAKINGTLFNSMM
jgi:high-affinity K+ transport system ATPase subunit B